VAFPEIRTQNTYSSTGSASHAITMPTGVDPGDLLIVYANNFGGAAWTVSSGTGWAKIAENIGGNSNTLRAAWWAKVATGSGDNLTLDTSSGNDVSAVSMRITRHGVTDPATDLTASADAEATSGTAPDPANCNPGVAKDYLWLEAHAAGGTVSTTATYWSTNYTGVDQLRSAATNASLVGVAYRERNAASENPGTMAFTGGIGWVAHTLAVPPAPAGQSELGAARRRRSPLKHMLVR
jgi:hypothetical protein